MEKHYALINNSIIENIIVADDDFVQLIKDNYEAIVFLNPLYDTGIYPAIGWSYLDGVFSLPD